MTIKAVPRLCFLWRKHVYKSYGTYKLFISHDIVVKFSIKYLFNGIWIIRSQQVKKMINQLFPGTKNHLCCSSWSILIWHHQVHQNLKIVNLENNYKDDCNYSIMINLHPQDEGQYLESDSGRSKNKKSNTMKNVVYFFSESMI